MSDFLSNFNNDNYEQAKRKKAEAKTVTSANVQQSNVSEPMHKATEMKENIESTFHTAEKNNAIVPTKDNNFRSVSSVKLEDDTEIDPNYKKKYKESNY